MYEGVNSFIAFISLLKGALHVITYMMNIDDFHFWEHLQTLGVKWYQCNKYKLISFVNLRPDCICMYMWNK